MKVATNFQEDAGPGSFVSALRPALLGAAMVGLLPFSTCDANWRLCSMPAARCALLITLVLALLVTSRVTEPQKSWVPSNAVEVYTLIWRLHGPALWAGVAVWVWVRARRLQAYFCACREHEQLFGTVDLQSAARHTRRFVLGILLMISVTVIFMLLKVSQIPTWLQIVTIVQDIGVYSGVIFWLAIFTGACWSLEDAFRAVDDRLQTALRKGNVPQLRRLTQQHGHLSQLTDLLCHTFGGLIAAYLYMLLLDVSLTIYMQVRTFTLPDGDSLHQMLLMGVFAPLPPVLMKLVTNAGHDLSRQSRQAASLLRSHLLNADPAAQDLELTELLPVLNGHQVHMDMAGYFTLDRTFFIQSLKDIVTLIIAMAQFEMA